MAAGQKTTFYTILVFLQIISFGCVAENINAVKQTPKSIKEASTNENQLVLATGNFDPRTQNLSFLSTNITNRESKKYGIVQFENKKADFQWLLNKGFKVVQSIPNNAYLVNWEDRDKSVLDSHKDIRWYGNFQSGYKVSPRLWARNREKSSSFQLAFRTFKDVHHFNLDRFIRKFLPKVKVVNTNIPAGSNQYVLTVEAQDMDVVLNRLSSNENIQWINLYHSQNFYNNEAVSATQATSVPVTTPIFNQGIYGTGQIVGVADSGLDRNEDWFMHLDKGSGPLTAITDAENVNPPVIGTLHPNNKVIAYWVMPGAEAYDHNGPDVPFHGTHVSGSVAGDRKLVINSGALTSFGISSPVSSGYDNDDGMAPNAQILFNDIGSASGLTGAGSLPMWRQAYAAGAAIHSNSYGAPTAGEYTGSDQRADETLRELEDMIILFAAGNDAFANMIGSPGNAKNVTTVGALGHGNSTAIASFSSEGPTDDGRLKPDISATGSDIQSAGGDTNNTFVDSSPSPRTMSGTSMATPITAGSTALLRQYFMDGFYPTGIKNSADSITPSGALMKAVLLNGTNTDVGFFENDVGWGRVWLENSLYFSGESKKMRIWDITNNDGLITGEQFSTTVTVQTGNEFRATLVWYDLKGSIGAGISLVNNLDLTVQIGADTYKANNFSGGPYPNNNSVTSGLADILNTVEQVRFSNPISGTYTITVDAANIPGDGTFLSDKQGFALVVSGDLSSGNSIPLNPLGPSNLNATSNGLAGINLSWTAASNDYDHYEVYRVQGTCASSDLTKARLIGAATTYSFTDSNTTGGFSYAYKVRAFSDDLISEYSNCIDIVSEQICEVPPLFDANTTQVTSSQANLCQVSLAWDAATSRCPSTTDIQYNIYRSTVHNFIPSLGNKIATTSLNTTGFTDYTTTSSQTYFYVVKAEDATTSGSGPNSGNETLAIKELVATSLGNGTVEGNIIDDVDNFSVMKLTSIWSISSEQASNGSLSYRSAIEGSGAYESNICEAMYSPTFEIPASPSASPNITYQARFDFEQQWDGVVVEISEDGGFNWVDFPPDGGYPSDFSNTVFPPMSTNPPLNACGYIISQGAFSGTNNIFTTMSHDLSAYNGKAVQIRWVLSTDPGTEAEGFYLDELEYNNIQVPQACIVGAYIFSNGFEN